MLVSFYINHIILTSQYQVAIRYPWGIRDQKGGIRDDRPHIRDNNPGGIGISSFLRDQGSEYVMLLGSRIKNLGRK